MKKLFIVCLAVVMAVVFGFGSAFAASAKVTAKCGEIAVVPFDGVYRPIFTQTIKTAQQKDLFIDVSLECGLMTDTKVVSRLLGKAEATAEAIVMVRVLVDGTMDGDPVALPGEIIFARREQTLIANFAGDISACLVDLNTGAIIINETCLLPETLQLILDTMSANSFNFIVKDLLAGTHTITVEAKLSIITSTEILGGTTGTAAIAEAYLGKGSVTIEEVRMIKDEDVEL